MAKGALNKVFLGYAPRPNVPSLLDNQSGPIHVSRSKQRVLLARVFFAKQQRLSNKKKCAEIKPASRSISLHMFLKNLFLSRRFQETLHC